MITNTSVVNPCKKVCLWSSFWCIAVGFGIWEVIRNWQIWFVSSGITRDNSSRKLPEIRFYNLDMGTFRSCKCCSRQSIGVNSVCSYLGVKLRQLFFIQVSLGVDASFITELKNKNRQSADRFGLLICLFLLHTCALYQAWKTTLHSMHKHQEHGITFVIRKPLTCVQLK